MMNELNFDKIELTDYPSVNIRPFLIEIHISDIHFGVLDPEWQYKILKEQFINEIAKLNFHILSINGDLYDHKFMSNSSAVQYCNMFLADVVDLCRIKGATLVIIKGTREHEADQLSQYYHYMKDDTVDVRIIETISMENIKGANILCIPELYDVDENIVQEKLHSIRYDSVFMHGTFEGAVYGDNSGSSRLFTMDDFSDCIGPIIGGHVHTPGCFKSHMYYTGCPYRWSYGQEEEKGFMIVAHNLQTGYYYAGMQHIKSFRYDTVYLDDLLNSDPKDIINYINTLKKEQGIDNIRVKFNSEVNDDTSQILKAYYRNNSSVKIDLSNSKKLQAIKKDIGSKEEFEKYSYFFDSKLDEYDILSRYINEQEGYAFITASRLKELVTSDIF